MGGHDVRSTTSRVTVLHVLNILSDRLDEQLTVWQLTRLLSETFAWTMEPMKNSGCNVVHELANYHTPLGFVLQCYFNGLEYFPSVIVGCDALPFLLSFRVNEAELDHDYDDHAEPEITPAEHGQHE